MTLLSRQANQTWVRFLRLALACLLALGPASHSLAMAAVAEQQAQVMPCHASESADPATADAHIGCHCGNAAQCTCAMAPTLPVMPLITASNETDDYVVARISLNTHLPPAPEPPPPRR